MPWGCSITAETHYKHWLLIGVTAALVLVEAYFVFRDSGIKETLPTETRSLNSDRSVQPHEAAAKQKEPGEQGALAIGADSVFDLLPTASCSELGLSVAERKNLSRSVQGTAEARWDREFHQARQAHQTARDVIEYFASTEDPKTDGQMHVGYVTYRLINSCYSAPETEEELASHMEDLVNRIGKDARVLNVLALSQRNQLEYCNGISKDPEVAETNLIAAVEAGDPRAVIQFASELPRKYRDIPNGERLHAIQAIEYLKKSFGPDYTPSIPFQLATHLYGIADGDVSTLVEAYSYVELLRRVAPSTWLPARGCNGLLEISTGLTTLEQLDALELARAHFKQWTNAGGLDVETLAEFQ